MVVDDDEVVREAVRGAFEAEGWVVSEASSGAEALDLLAGPPWPDVLVLDLVMPGMDGLAVLTELRGRPGGEGIAVVVLSARRSPLATRVFASLGADGCIPKPVDPTALRSHCTELLSA